MSKTSNDINYLKGLVEGKNIAENSEESKILSSLVNIVAEQNAEIEELKDRIHELEHFRDDLDRSFTEAERLFDTMMSGSMGLSHLLEGEEYDDDDEEDFYEVECQACKNKFGATFMDFIEDNVVCPECGQHFELSDDVLEKLLKESFDE